jgi:hypothetical protein
LAGLLAVTAMTGCTQDEPSTGPTRDVSDAAVDEDTGGAGLLYVQRAPSGSTSIDGDGSNTITFDDVETDTTWFQDRPGRRAGRIPTAQLVSSWAGIFGDDPPNAAIELIAHDGSQSTHVVELRNPSLDDSGALTYAFDPAEGDDVELPASFGSVSIFIDDAPSTLVQPVTFVVSDATAGQSVSIELQTNGAQVQFGTGATESNQTWFQTTSPNGSLDVQQLSLSNTALTIDTATDGGGGGNIDFEVQVDLAADVDIDTFYLLSTSDPGTSITASFGESQEIEVTNSPTLVPWDSE